MSQRATFLLSPYRPPTSYPVTLAADEAAAWLNGYFALWHPAALMDAPGPPVIASAYDHDLPLEDALYVVPEGPQLFQADDWPERVQKANAHLIRPTADAAATRASLLAALNAEDVYEDVATGFADRKSVV